MSVRPRPPIRPATSSRTMHARWCSRPPPLDETHRDPRRAGRHARRRLPTGRSPTWRSGCATCIRHGASLRVSYRRAEPHPSRRPCETPSPLVPGERYRVRMQLNDARRDLSRRPPDQARALHHLLADDLAGAATKATVTIFGGTLDLPVRPAAACGCGAAALPGPETATPRRRSPASRMRSASSGHGRQVPPRLKDDDPPSAVAEMRRAETKRRGDWQVRFETSMRLTCTRDVFRLRRISARGKATGGLSSRMGLRNPRDLV